MTKIAKEFLGRRKLLGKQTDAAAALSVSSRYIQKIEACEAIPSATLMKLLRLLTPGYAETSKAKKGSNVSS